MEKAHKKHEYQSYIDHIISSHDLAGSSLYNKEKEFVCHLDVDKILVSVKNEFTKKQKAIRADNSSLHNPQGLNSHNTPYIPKRESLIMNSNHVHNKNMNMSRGFLSLFS